MCSEMSRGDSWGPPGGGGPNRCYTSAGMAFSLANSHLHFSLDQSASTWSLYTQSTETPAIEGARLNGLFRFARPDLSNWFGLRPWQWRGWLDDAEIATRTEPVSRHGVLDMLGVRVRSGRDELGLTVEFALPREQPGLLIRLRVRNQGRAPFRVLRLNPLFAGPLHHAGSLRLTPSPAPLTFFSNGWQSWSFAGTLTANRHQPATWLKPIQGPLIHNPLTPLPDYRGQFAGDMFGVLACPSQRTAIVAGFLSQREQFGSVDVVAKAEAPSLRLRAQCDDVSLAPGAELQTDWAYVQLSTGYGLDPLQDYAEAVARENQVSVPRPAAPTEADSHVFDSARGGWCSWYHYFNKVTEGDLRSNLEQIVKERERLPLQLVQLDDGFEANVGDWFAVNDKFPSGLRAVSDSIRTQGLLAGLWLAPFIALPQARLAQDHPDWLLRNRLGLPANAGYVFDTFARGLDVTHPGVQDHTRRLIQTAVRDWGFQYLKLDFLYAAALPGRRHDPTRTRAQAMRLGLELIREAAGPETFLLGCGCPLGSAVGLVEAMRIGPDVAVRWRPRYSGVSLPFREEPGMPSARNAIRNTLTRMPLHRRWWLNDPDCLLVRDTTSLTQDEVIALASVIAMSGGLLVLSDDLAALTPERRRLIDPLLPVLGKAALGLDWLEREMPETLELSLHGAAGDWRVMGLFNWSETPGVRSLALPAESHIFDFWSQTYHRAAGVFTTPRLAPHSGCLLAVRPVSAGPQFVGSSLHFSQGAEIEAWQATDRDVRFVINLNRSAEGSVTLALPDGSPATGERITDGVYRFPVVVPGRVVVAVAW